MPNPSPSLLMLLLLLFCLPCGLDSAQAPLDALANEVSELKTMITSVQGSLITSIRLIQDQMDQFGKQHLTQIDSRLTQVDAKLSTLGQQVANVEERAHVWDTFQHHVRAWADLMTSMDSKVDHLGRSQTEQLTNVASQLTSIQTNLGIGVSQLAEKLDTIDGHVSQQKPSHPPPPPPSDPVAEFTTRGALATLQSIDSKLNTLTARNRLRPTAAARTSASSSHPPIERQGHVCQDIKEAVNDMSSKLDTIHDKIVISEDHNNKAMTISDLEQEEEYSDHQTHQQQIEHLDPAVEKRLMKLFHRIVAPFKKASKRLRDMDHMRTNFDQTLNELSTNVESAVVDVDRKFNDFFNMTMEMFEHQHHQLEEYQQRFASIEHCCQGTNGDLSSLKAGAMPILDRLDAYLLSKARSGLSDQRDDRIREQLRFDMNRFMAELKAHERELIDTCGLRSDLLKNITATETFNYTMTVSEKVSLEAEVEATTAVAIEVSNELLKTCEDLMKAGILTSKPYTFDGVDDEENEGGRAYNKRFCEQSSSGGGWTVVLNRADILPRTNFTRPWADYKSGFGDLSGEFWFGNDFIHRLTSDHRRPVVLRVELEDFDGVTAFAEYQTFRVASESDDFRLSIGGFSGNATDSLAAHNGHAFSTVDRINDEAPKCCPCAPAYGGGWWFYSCFESNLNGEYHSNPTDNDYFRGIIWELWRGDYSLKAARMMVRSKEFSVVQDGKRGDNEDGQLQQQQLQQQQQQLQQSGRRSEAEAAAAAVVGP